MYHSFSYFFNLIAIVRRFVLKMNGTHWNISTEITITIVNRHSKSKDYLVMSLQILLWTKYKMKQLKDSLHFMIMFHSVFYNTINYLFGVQG